MKTGFYDLSKLNDDQLKSLYTDCLMNSHLMVCESKYIKESYRTLDDKYSISEMLNMVSTECHNVFVNRSVQHPRLLEIDPGRCYEAGFKIDTEDWYQNTFHLSKERFEMLVSKYKLKMN